MWDTAKMPTTSQRRLAIPTTEHEFDEMVRDVLKAANPNAHLVQFARRGQSQHGIDGFSQADPDGLVWQATIQRLNLVAKLEADYQKMRKQFPFTPREFIFAAATERDGPTQEFAARLTREPGHECMVRTMFWEEVQEGISANPKLLEKYYPDLMPPAVTKTKPPPRETPAAWVVLESAAGDPVSCGVFSGQFKLGDRAGARHTIPVLLRIRNLGREVADTVRITFRWPRTSAVIGATTDDSWSALVDIKEPITNAAGLQLWPEISKESGDILFHLTVPRLGPQTTLPLIPLIVGLTEPARPTLTSSRVYFEVSVGLESHSAGWFEVEVKFRASPPNEFEWTQRSLWVRNQHPNGEELLIHRRDAPDVVGPRHVCRLSSSTLVDARNRHVVDWVESGWAKRCAPPPWANPSPVTYVYRHNEQPRLYVRRAHRRSRVLKFGDAIELAPEDFQLPENALLTTYVLDKKIVPTAHDPWPAMPDGTRPTVNIGYLPSERVEILDGEVRVRLTEAEAEEYTVRLLDQLRFSADENGTTAGSLSELEGWLEFKVSPSELREFLSRLEATGDVTLVEPIDRDWYALRATPRAGAKDRKS